MLRAINDGRDDDFDALEGLFKQLQEVFMMMGLPWDPDAEETEGPAEASRPERGPC